MMTHLFLTNISIERLFPVVAWTLIHSIWQGLLVATLALAASISTRRSNAVRRYNLFLILIMAFAGMVAATFVLEWRNTSMAGMDIPVPILFVSKMHYWGQLINKRTDYLTGHASSIVAIWFIFFLYRSIKIAAGLVYNRRARMREVYEPGLAWTEAVERLSKRLQIKKMIKLLQSSYIKMPVVIGHLKPTILMPLGILSGLPSHQVEAILLHELAHIRRNDYLVNLLQNILEAVFFFNPGLLWLSSMLREERENCCDDMALAQTGDKREFVRALIGFKEHALYDSVYATAFGGKKSNLVYRVNRILKGKNKRPGLGEKLFLGSSILLLSVILTAARIAQATESKRSETGITKPVSTETTLSFPAVLKKNSMRIKAVEKTSQVAVIKEKVGSMPPISERKEPVAAVSTVIEAVPASVLNKKQRESAD